MSGWPSVRLSTLATFRNGLNFPAEARGKGLAIVGVRDFQDRSFVLYDNLEELDPSALSSPDSLIAKDDILFVRSNGNRELIGRSLLVAETPPKATSHSGFTIRLRFTDSKALPRFFAYVLRGGVIRRLLSSKGGGTNINNLSQGILGGLDVPLPPIREQRRIAEILGAYDDLIDVNRRRIALLEEMARGLFEEWFVRFRFPGHDSKTAAARQNGSLPVGWARRELGSFLSLAYGKALRADDREPGRFPVIGSSGIVGSHSAPLVDRPGIILGRKGNVGAVVWSPTGFWPIDTVYYVNSERPQLYLLEMLRRVSFQNTDAAVPGLNREAALKKVVADPPVELAQRYHEFCGSPRALSDQLQASIRTLGKSRDLLLPRLISGQTSIAAAERELAQAA